MYIVVLCTTRFGPTQKRRPPIFLKKEQTRTNTTNNNRHTNKQTQPKHTKTQHKNKTKQHTNKHNKPKQTHNQIHKQDNQTSNLIDINISKTQEKNTKHKQIQTNENMFGWPLLFCSLSGLGLLFVFVSCFTSRGLVHDTT